MKIKVSCRYTLFTLTLLCSLFAAARPELLPGNEIPLMTDAKVFARFDQSYPKVINYFTGESEQAILALYSQSYGEPISSERKRGRLTVSYIRDNSHIRIIISEQDKKRQVDILKLK